MWNNNVDAVRGAGIILVVLGHTVSPLRDEIYFFHMPLFFIISGLFFNHQLSTKDFTIKKLQSLIIPYFTFSVIIYLFYLFFSLLFDLPYNFRMILKIIDLNGTVSTPLWFLLSLFITTLGFKCFLSKNLSINQVLVIAAAINLFVFIYSQYFDFNPLHAFTSLFSLLFLVIGQKLNSLILEIIEDSKKALFTIVISFISFYFFSRYVTSTDYNSIHFEGNYFAILGSAISGSLFLISITTFLRQLFFVKKTLSFLGKKSLIIFVFHLPLFEFSRPISTFFFEKDTYIWGISVTIFAILLCLPLIYIFEKYFPVLIGKKDFSRFRNKNAL
jgi:fucose 4-O-acetylase-like acetyltransferase